MRRLGRLLHWNAGSTDRYDMVFVVAPQNRGEILESICRHIARHVQGTTSFHYECSPLPPADAYFFSHYMLFLACRSDPQLRNGTSLVWFTHPSYDASEASNVAIALRSADIVLSGSSLQARELIAAGLPADQVVVVPPGADPQVFCPHQRADRPVGFCSTYRGARKAPEMVLELVRTMPDREFRLLGHRWREAPVFASLVALSNFRYLEMEYSRYPLFYDDIDVFVSPSKLEGQGIPILEAMMANVVPVATRTGFAPDLIHHGHNGFLCDVGAAPEVMAELIERAYTLDADVRSTVEHVTWDAFAQSVLQLVLAKATG